MVIMVLYYVLNGMVCEMNDSVYVFYEGGYLILFRILYLLLRLVVVFDFKSYYLNIVRIINVGKDMYVEWDG